MSSRIKGLFSSKKKKDERASTKAHSKELFAASASSQRSTVSFTSQTHRAASVGSFTSSTSAFEVQRDGVVSKGEVSFVSVQETRHLDSEAGSKKGRTEGRKEGKRKGEHKRDRTENDEPEEEQQQDEDENGSTSFSSRPLRCKGSFMPQGITGHAP